ncbi:hypothetical protein [Maribacter flavus]|uniref:Uncharacterized protein n=1 Tax=Maribacter flavus TaxID=1658664 RepID=A0A5B2TW91_9FLAO|nr:hypothetical protein [Maribacter flavus]KAA2218509.1 hypothetical protein F0361_02490 [Maribacter flavus]
MKESRNSTDENINQNVVNMNCDQTNNIFDYGELAIGIGTFVLGIAVAIATWYNASKDRKVHISDKQQDWLIQFREITSNLIGIQNQLFYKYWSIIDTNITTDEIVRGRQDLGHELEKYQAQLLLMFDSNDKIYKKFVSHFAIINPILFKGALSEENLLIGARNKMFDDIHQTIKKQKKRIANLNTKNPLI